MTAKTIVIGLDIGTTSTIAVAVSWPGEILAVASRPVSLFSPKPGWAEEDPEQWWANSVAVLNEVLSGLDISAVAGLCVTGMLPAVVLLDGQGKVLRPSIQQSDGRCSAEVAELKAELDESSFLQRTGNGINQQLVAAKLRWIDRHEPDVFARIGTVFGSYDYINWQLTGVRAVEQNWALEAGFTDLATDSLDDNLIALGHIARTVVPPRSLSHAQMGKVSTIAAAATGLPDGLPVFGGAADHIVSALGAGITRSGDVLLKFGGAGDIVVATDKPLSDNRLYLDYHLIPGLYAPNGCMATSGSALNWLAGLITDLGDGEQRPHEALDALAAQVAPGADGLLCLPYFLGEKTPIHDPKARGCFVGLSFSHTKAHLWRAALEAVAFGFRHHIDVLHDIGHMLSRYVASDGGSRSQVWMQITADVIGAPVSVLDNAHGSAVGAAFVAAMGVGLARDWSEVSVLSNLGRTVQPDPVAHREYDRAYARYRELYRVLSPYFQSQT